MISLAFAVAMALPAFAERALQVSQSLSAHGHAGISLHEDEEYFLAMIVPPAVSPRPRCSTGTYQDSDHASNLYRHPALAMLKPPWPPRW
jgi:hypothetical protein